jgi:ABC-type antimicrobial peptide transport system permease subunit
MVRVAGDPHAMFPTLREALQREAPPSTFVSLAAVDDAVSRVVRPWRIGALVLTAFGALGLLIASLGLYSVLAYTVSQRSAEIGIRMALGDTPPSVIASVIADGMRVVLVGVAAGLAAALVAGRWINAVLFGVTTADPLVLPLTIAALLAAALLASAVPAWRASRVDPADALRAG